MPRHAREVYVRRRFAVGAAALVVLGGSATGVYSAVALGLPIPAAVAEVAAPEIPIGPAVAPESPGYGSSGVGAVGWDEPLVLTGDDNPRPIASISKVVTALVVLERMPLGPEEDGPTRTLTRQDEAYYDQAVLDEESRAPASAGSAVSEREALEAMLIVSAGNYARTLVDWAFGSNEAFAVAAADWIREHGLTGTTIVEPTGVSPQNRSTVRDLIAIGELAIADPVVGAIVAERSAVIPDVGELDSSNKLLGVDGIDGIKTGTLDEAGACLLFSADVAVGGETVTVVGAVLGGPDHETVDASVRALLESVVAGFQEIDAVEAGESFGEYATAWGATADAVASSGASFLVWGPEQPTVQVELEPLTTAEAGAPAGTITVSTARESSTIALVLDAAIPDPGAGWRWTHPGR